MHRISLLQLGFLTFALSLIEHMRIQGSHRYESVCSLTVHRHVSVTDISELGAGQNVKNQRESVKYLSSVFVLAVFPDNGIGSINW